MLKKIIYITTLLIALFFFCSAGIFYYYYTHPEAVASLIKGSVSRSMNVSVNIKNLSYSISPLRILAEDIRLTPVRGSSGFFIDVPKMAAKFSLTGSFGRRSLVAEKIEIKGFSLRYNKADFRLAPKPAPSDFLGGWLLKSSVALLLFRDVRIDAVKLTEGNVTATLNGPVFNATGVSIHRRADKRIELESTARLQWPEKGIDITIPEFYLSAHHAMSLSEMTMEAKILAKKMVLKSAVTKLTGVDLEAEGNLDFNSRHLGIGRLALSISDHFSLRGTLNVDYTPQTHVKLIVEGSEFSPEYIVSILPDRLKKTLPPVDVGGRVSTEGSLDVMKKGDGWKWDYRLKSHLSQNRLAYSTEQARMSGKISGSIGVRGSLSEVSMSGDLKMNDSEFSSNDVQAKFPDIRFSVSGKHPVYQIKDASLRISTAKMLKPAKGMSFSDVRLSSPSGIIDIHKKTYRFSQIQMSSPLTGAIEGMIETDGKDIHIQMEGKETRLLASLKDFELLPSGWQFGGHNSVWVDATLNKGAALSFDSRINLKEFRVQDAIGRFAGENLSLELHTNGNLDLDGGSIAGTTSVKVTNGEILYDLFYLNLGDNNFTASARASYDYSNKKIGPAEVNLEFKDILSLSAAGSLNVKEPFPTRLSIQLYSNPLPPLFKMFLMEPFGREKPYLKDIKVDGRVSTDLEWAGTAGDWSIKGVCRWRDGRLSFKDGKVSAAGIDMDYPVWYQSGTLKRESNPLAGKLSIESLSLPYLPEQPLQFIIHAKPNQVSIATPTHIKLSEGDIVIGPVTVRDVFSLNASAVTSLRVNRSDISLPMSKIWPHPVPATIEGRLEQILIERERIESQGELVVEAFDGKTTLTGLGVTRFLSTAPLVRLNAEFNGLQLGRITTDTPVGRIDGILRGHIKNLEVAYGQPQHFDMLLETEKRKDIEQKISIQAIDTIARVGGGQSPFVGFSAIFTSFFETLSYEKIGIRSTLKNDLIRINGTIVEDKKEYIMKGSALAGVNIINQNPNNRIRFKDMIKRIKRVTEGGKPVIR